LANFTNAASLVSAESVASQYFVGSLSWWAIRLATIPPQGVRFANNPDEQHEHAAPQSGSGVSV